MIKVDPMIVNNTSPDNPKNETGINNAKIRFDRPINPVKKIRKFL